MPKPEKEKVKSRMNSDEKKIDEYQLFTAKVRQYFSLQQEIIDGLAGLKSKKT